MTLRLVDWKEHLRTTFSFLSSFLLSSRSQLCYLTTRETVDCILSAGVHLRWHGIGRYSSVIRLFSRSEGFRPPRATTFVLLINSSADPCDILSAFTSRCIFRCHSALGYLSQELIGTNFYDFIHEDDRSRFTDTWNRGKKAEAHASD